MNFVGGGYSSNEFINISKKIRRCWYHIIFDKHGFNEYNSIFMNFPNILYSYTRTTTFFENRIFKEILSKYT